MTITKSIPNNIVSLRRMPLIILPSFGYGQRTIDRHPMRAIQKTTTENVDFMTVLRLPERAIACNPNSSYPERIAGHDKIACVRCGGAYCFAAQHPDENPCADNSAENCRAPGIIRN